MKEQTYERARKRVKEKKEFFRHLSSYVSVIGFLCLLNLFTSPGHFWAIYPALGWGIGLFSHYTRVFGFLGNRGSADWEDRELEKEMRRLEGGRYEEDSLELRELEADKEKSKKWRNEDLV